MQLIVSYISPAVWFLLGSLLWKTDDCSAYQGSAPLGLGAYSAPNVYSNPPGAQGQRPLQIPFNNIPNINQLNYNQPPAQPLAPSDDKTEIHKHVYISVAPDMPAPPPIRILANNKNTRHYKIVFIKAPSMPAPQVILPEVNPLNEEKTLIYVLSENPRPITAPYLEVGPGSQPKKPEVFFIKYDGPTDKNPVTPRPDTGSYGSGNYGGYGGGNSGGNAGNYGGYGGGNGGNYGAGISNGEKPSSQGSYPSVPNNGYQQPNPSFPERQNVPVRSPLLHVIRQHKFQ